MTQYIWTGTLSNEFGTAGNWDDTGTGQDPSLTVPGSLDTATFDSAGGTISGSGTMATLQFVPDSEVPNVDWLVIGTLDAVGAGITSSDTVIIGAAGVLEGTDYNQYTGALDMQAGSQMILTGAPNGPYLPNAFGLNGTGTIDGGTLDAAGGGVGIGGDLLVEGGATVTALAGSPFAGVTVGTLTITGPSTVWSDIGTNQTIDGTIYFPGYMNVNGATLVVVDHATLADSGAGIDSINDGGSATIATGAVWTDGAGLSVGVTGGGTLSVLSGGTIYSTGSLDIIGPSRTGGGVGIATVDGAGSTWDTTGALIVANAGTGALTVSDNGYVSATTQIAVGQLDGSVGTLSIENGGTVDTTGNINVGNTGGSDGTVYVGAGSTLEVTGTLNPFSYELIVGQAASTLVSGGSTIPAAVGAIYVAGSLALLTTDGNPAVIGDRGVGTLSVTGGATASFGSSDASNADVALFVGEYGSGSLIVDGPGSEVTANNDAAFAHSGTASLTVSNSGSFIAGDAANGIQIGNGNSIGFGGTATAILTSDGYLYSASNLSVGRGGDSGTLEVSDGAMAVAANQIFIGRTNTNNGTLFGGSGLLEIGAGGTVVAEGNQITSSNTAALRVADGIGSTGTLVVTGPGAVLSTGTQYITIGNYGTGSVTVSQGGSVSAGIFTTANAATLIGTNGGQGSLVVTGTDSTWTAVGQMEVGSVGSGTLSAVGSLLVESGGTVATGGSTLSTGAGFVVGYGSASSGGVIVTGVGSEIINVGHFIVGGSDNSGLPVGGVGTVLIADGGLVQTTETAANFSAPAADIAADPGTGGSSVTVTGTNSTWQIAGPLVVGDYVAGGLTIAAGGTVSATQLDVGAQATSAGTIALSGAGSNLQVTGLATIGATGTLLGNGVVVGAIQNSGLVDAAGGLLLLDGAVSGGGAFDIESDGTLELVGTGGSAVDVSFNGAGTLILDAPGTYTGTIDLLSAGGTIDVADDANATIDITDNILMVVGDSGTYDFTLLGNSGDVSVFTSAGGSFGGAPCYCAGTLIRTENGDVPVESLRIGDTVITLHGGLRPIKWIGQRSYIGRFVAGNREILPILIRAGALDDGVPARDLYVSPMHAMYLDDVLIPAHALVNDTTIVQVEAVERVDYFHVELETHSIILAEGAASETFIDDDSRAMFHNAAEYFTLYPHTVPPRAAYCAPRIEDGDELEIVRRRLAARGNPTPPIAPARLRGRLDHVGRERISGWASYADDPDRPVRLRILDGGVLIGEVVAAQYREDLETFGIGGGFHGFEMNIPGGLSPLVRHVIEVRCAVAGQDLPNSPWTLDAQAECPRGEVGAPDGARGRLDEATRERISGWAWGAFDPNASVALAILDNGITIGRVLANRRRADLAAAGIGTGRHAFEFAVPGGLSPLARHVISVRREADGGEIANSPIVIEAAGSFDRGAQQAVTAAIEAAGSQAEQEQLLAFLLAQTDRLLQRRADGAARRGERLALQEFRRRRGAPADSDPQGPALRRRALVVDERMPRAGRDGGSQVVIAHMGSLQRLGHDVSFVAAGEMAGAEAAAASLSQAGITVCAAPFYHSVEDVLKRQAGCFDVVYLHRAEIAGRYLALARLHAPDARLLYSVADLHHVRLARQAAIEARPDLLARSRRLKVTEHAAAVLADAVITHSTVEADLLRRAGLQVPVHVIPWEVPVRATRVPFRQRAGVAFIGNFSHAPNQDAAFWLVETIMQLVWNENPRHCLPAGRQRHAGPGPPSGRTPDQGRWRSRGSCWRGLRPGASDRGTPTLWRRRKSQGCRELCCRSSLRDERRRRRRHLAVPAIAGADRARSGCHRRADLPAA